MYLLPPEEAEKYEKVLDACHAKFVNPSEWTKELETLSALLCTKAEYVEPAFKKHACRWVPFEVDTTEPLVGCISKVYYSGFCD